ncbi:hypothetical protein CEXT_370271 [Caerostris extrusa]|uniref:Uncharacterized protein n=1 Tax=Caerostris extrusa TaxID=172846 RepID=A0AAV4NHS0_CAEEX|nr:hypothetical protein CEXT_370271 [Caerostris extrusa]
MECSIRFICHCFYSHRIRWNHHEVSQRHDFRCQFLAELNLRRMSFRCILLKGPAPAVCSGVSHEILIGPLHHTYRGITRVCEKMPRLKQRISQGEGRSLGLGSDEQ